MVPIGVVTLPTLSAIGGRWIRARRDCDAVGPDHTRLRPPRGRRRRGCWSTAVDLDDDSLAAAVAILAIDVIHDLAFSSTDPQP